MKKKEDPIKKPDRPALPGEKKDLPGKDEEKEQDNMDKSRSGKSGNPPPEKEIRPKKDL
jgi:hypothetical protein